MRKSLLYKLFGWGSVPRKTAPAMEALHISVPRDGLLRIEFDAGVFDPKRSGSVECNYHTGAACSLKERLERGSSSNQ